ncbi:hypothetical protein MMC30_000573, partial [Trapelia coarctata]|nr:hypothetical protein [Trapelia coarctata]
MNWTGGRLQQSQRSGATITAKQRNHFARARATLGKPPLPPHFDLAHAQQDYEASRRRGLVDVKSLNKVHGPADAVPTNKRISSTRTRTILESSPRLVVRKRKADKALDLDTEEGLFAKRMEILDKLKRKTWLSNPTPKPLTISFPSSEEVRMIGRRRKLTDGEKKRHEERMKAQRQNVSSQNVSKKRMGQTHHDQNGVRTEITSPIIQTTKQVPTVRPEDASPASIQSRLQRPSPPSSRSDPMLLDGNISSFLRIP